MAKNKTNRPAGRPRGDHSEALQAPRSRRAAVRAEGRSTGERKRPPAPRRGGQRHSAGRRTPRADAAAVLQPGGSPSAADGSSGGRPGEEDRARGSGGQGEDGELQPPARISKLASTRTSDCRSRPDPGGRPRADPRLGEVRLEARIQVLDVRHSLDPAVDPTSAGQHGRTIRIRSTSSNDNASSPRRELELTDSWARPDRRGADADAELDLAEVVALHDAPQATASLDSRSTRTARLRSAICSRPTLPSRSTRWPPTSARGVAASPVKDSSQRGSARSWNFTTGSADGPEKMTSTPWRRNSA